MSDALDKVQGIRHLPIFPLPLVMLPNEVLPLHIFEERYRQMLKDVDDSGRFFGIIRFEPDGAFDLQPRIGTVGCVAEIREAETLADGRSNILTLGVVRFRLNGYVEAGEPYLVADIECFTDEKQGEEDLDVIAERVYLLFERMAKAAFKMGGSRGQFPEIQRTDAESLSFLITAAFNFDNEKKYRLLEMRSTSQRLRELETILNQSVYQIEENAELQVSSRTNGHSKKKIDL